MGKRKGPKLGEEVPVKRQRETEDAEEDPEPSTAPGKRTAAEVRAAKKQRRWEKAAAEEGVTQEAEQPPPVTAKKKKKAKEAAVEEVEEDEADEAAVKAGKKKKKAKTNAESEDSEEAEPVEPVKKKIQARQAPEAESEAEEDAEPLRLRVHGMSYKADKEAITAHFAKCGGVAKVKLLKDPKRRKKHSGVVLVTMADEAGCAKAIKKLDQQKFMDLRIRISRSGGAVKNTSRVKADRKAGENPGECASVVCKALASEVTEKDLRKLFKDCGAISNVKMLQDGRGKRCMAFVDFESHDCVEKAMEFSETSLKGKTFYMSYSKR